MKNKIIGLLGVFALVLSAFTYGVPLVKAIASPSWIAVISTATATTTVSYMTAGTATTTFNLYDSTKSIPNDTNVDATQLYIQYAASSTTAQLNWQYQYSNNAIDWFNEDQALFPVNGAISAASTTVTHQWTPGTTATSSKSTIVPAYPATYQRVLFTVPIGSGSGAVWAQAVLKHNPGSQ